jgi:general nucleoside transport system permease protein
MNELSYLAIFIGVSHSAIRLATPFLYASLGEMLGQRSGVLNLGVEGIMLMGAFFGFYGAFTTGNAWIGLLAAAIAGTLMGLLAAVINITLRAEQGISGIGLYLFGLGASSLLFKTMLGTVEGVRGFRQMRFCLANVGVESDFCLYQIPVIGRIFFDHSLIVYVAFLLVPVLWFVLNKTTWGLSVRAVGQNPAAADSLSVNVARIRYTTVTLGGLMAGIAGASLSIALLSGFQEGMTNGMGFIAVALVYFGGWSPVGVMAGALLFSTVQATQLWVQALGFRIPSNLAVMLPYLLTILALAVPFRRAQQPATLAKPFTRSEV